MAYKIPSPEGAKRLSMSAFYMPLMPECAYLNQYSICCSNNTHKYAVIHWAGDYTLLGCFIHYRITV